MASASSQVAGQNISLVAEWVHETRVSGIQNQGIMGTRSTIEKWVESKSN